MSLTDYSTTNLVDVDWTVTVINQHGLVLLTTPHITLPAHHHGRTVSHGHKFPWQGV